MRALEGPATLARAVLVILMLLPSAPAAARPGDLDEPIAIPGVPFVHASTTQGRASAIERYGCASQTSEAGPEVVYRLDVTTAGQLTATVEGDGGEVDIDVQLLGSLELEGAVAADCLARGNSFATASVGAGRYHVVVDSYQGQSSAGAYRLRVDFQPADDWYTRDVAQGVKLRTRHYASLGGQRQKVGFLDVDLSQPGVEVKPIGGGACTRTSTLAGQAGAVAAINGGFFDTGDCQSLSLLKIDGTLVASNAVSRTAFGSDALGRPMMALVPAGQDWPEAVQAVGGVPRLVTGGEVDVRTLEEGSNASFETTRHPRTAVGITPAGRVLLTIVDGRSTESAGMGLPELAGYLIDLGASEAVNLDGGGSTTLWVASEPSGGVVNEPSDASVTPHDGERAVSHALAVFAPALDRAPLFLTTPPATGPGPVTEGQPYVYEVVAADPEGAQVALSVGAARPDGEVTLEDRGDGTARLTFVPTWRDALASPVTLELLAEAPTGPAGSQGVTVSVAALDADGDGLPDGWEREHGLDPDRPGADEDPDGDGRTNAEELAAGTDPQVPDLGQRLDAGPGDDTAGAADAATGSDGAPAPLADSGPADAGSADAVVPVTRPPGGCSQLASGAAGAGDASALPWLLLALGLVVGRWAQGRGSRDLARQPEAHLEEPVRSQCRPGRPEGCAPGRRNRSTSVVYADRHESRRRVGHTRAASQASSVLSSVNRPV